MKTKASVYVIHGGADALKKSPGLTFRSVAIGIKQQVQLDALAAKRAQTFDLALLQFPRCKMGILQLIAAAVWKVPPGKIDFVDVFFILYDTIQKCIVGVLQADCIFHSDTPPDFVFTLP
jgi:hypothetical protein